MEAPTNIPTEIQTSKTSKLATKLNSPINSLILGLYLIFVAANLFIRATIVGEVNVYIQYCNFLIIILFGFYSLYCLYQKNKNPIWVITTFVFLISVYLQYLISNLVFKEAGLPQKVYNQRVVRDLFVLVVAVAVLVKNYKLIFKNKHIGLPLVASLVFWLSQILYFFVIFLLLKN